MSRQQQVRNERRAERILVDGRLIHPRAKHGTASSYAHFGCQCKPCTAANAEHQLAYSERKKAQRAAARASASHDWVHDWIDDIARSTPNRKPLPAADLHLARLLREEMAA